MDFWTLGFTALIPGLTIYLWLRERKTDEQNHPRNEKQ